MTRLYVVTKWSFDVKPQLDQILIHWKKDVEGFLYPLSSPINFHQLPGASFINRA